MPDKVVRSGVAHSVVTNEITRNAINPRNEFIEIDTTPLDAFSETLSETHANSSQAALNQPVVQDRYDTRTSLSAPKARITRNLQKLSPEKPTDNNLFFESLQKLEDRIQHLREQHPTQNQQHIGRHDITDNVQSNGPIESTRDRVLYKEKKNIRKNVQHITESSPVRASANLLSPAPEVTTRPINLEAMNLEHLSVDDMNVLLDEAMKSFNEDELKARIRKMKERLASANQTLKEIEDQDAKDSSQEL